MRKIIHLSDLHFGRVNPELVEPMIEAIHAAQPDLVAISGDLTQRARVSQFREARAFIRRIEAPSLAVPGNHDVPLENVGMRMAAPFARFRRYICAELEPEHTDGDIAVVGINTTDPLSWQRGRIRSQALDRACRRLRTAGRDRVQIVVAHHPFEHLPGERKELMPGAETALKSLATCGARIVLSGHLHSWHAAPFTLPKGHGGVLQVQAGTGLSTRQRGEANDFNVLSVDRTEVTVERFVAAPALGSHRFTRTAALRFRLGPEGWEGIDRPVE